MFSNYKFFDPNLETIPPWRDTVYADVVDRAFTILGKRSVKEQQYAINKVNLILKNSENRALPGFEELRIDKYSNSPIHVLRYEIEKHFDPGDIHFHNASPADYLAVLALGLVREGFIEATHPEVTLLPGENPSNPVLDGSYHAEAEDAVEWAERLRNGTNLPTDLLANIGQLVGRKERERHGAAGKTGHTAGARIKQRFIDQWFRGDYRHCKRRDDAAEEFYNSLTDDDIDDLRLVDNADTPEKDRVSRLLCTALREAIRQRRE